MPEAAASPDQGDDPAERVRLILSYHERTKHHPSLYARGPDQLDWANQPDPFRTFAGAPAVDLPLGADALAAAYADLYKPAAIPPRRLDLGAVAVLFELALGLSAWKEYRGQRWALRCNPSSGNLHPTEGYAVVPPLPGLEAGVYHYDSRDHRLERRCALAGTAASRLPADSFLVGLSSVHWREAWKYGERAYRYEQHDLGHALAAVRYAAAALGWSARLLHHAGDEAVAALLGLDRDADFAGVDLLDREHPGALVHVGPPPLSVPAFDTGLVTLGAWTGKANRLSQDHVRWELIDRVALAARAPPTHPEPAWQPPTRPPLMPLRRPLPDPAPAAALIRQRRSAIDFDSRTGLDAAALFRMLDCLLPRPGVPPWDLVSWRPHLHLGLCVHRVAGLAPGLYLFERDPAQHESLRAACQPAFRWQRPADCPEHLPLYLLAEGDLRQTARGVSCHQDIAADGAFSLGMVAEFGDVLGAGGPWWYRRLYWEAGVLGQALYLEAEAAGVRSTGIGCYFDDAFHRVLGLAGHRFQDLYHFAVGAPVDDPRLRTLAPYAHRERAG